MRGAWRGAPPFLCCRGGAAGWAGREGDADDGLADGGDGEVSKVSASGEDDGSSGEGSLEPVEVAVAEEEVVLVVEEAHLGVGLEVWGEGVEA